MAAAASDDDAAGRMRENMRRQRQRPGPQATDGTISTVCRKVDCTRGAVRGPKGRALGHGLCRICAAEARVGAMATAALKRSKRKADDNAAGAAAEAAVHRQPSANAKGKARRVAREDEEDYLCRTVGCRFRATRLRSGFPTGHGMCRNHVPDDDFEEVYTCRKPGCDFLAVLNTRNNAPKGHGLCRVHGPYKERVRCSLPSCNERAQVNGRCKLHKA